MGNTATLETLLGVAIALIPATILVTLVFLWLRGLGQRRRAKRPEPLPAETRGEPLRVIPEPLSEAPYETDATVTLTPDPEPRPSAPPAIELAPPVPPESIDAITAKIENAIANREKTVLSGLYLDLAAAHAREGNLDAQMTALRSAAGHGALHGPHRAHAAARLALAEAAHQVGDLTSACEQWQLARTAFQEGGDEEQHARVEKRMRENGCPTDWVLTDF